MEPKTKVKDRLTTGQVSKMLGGAISQRTAIRYFDSGILRGWRRPATGWRLIDPKSVEALPKKRGLTTGEASKMLGISTCRIRRLFKQGILAGWKHPLTGWRMIDRESVNALAKKQGLTTGEVSRMLGGAISQTTVIKFFEQGTLRGWKNPVNGRRVIDPKSVKALVSLKWKRATTIRQAIDEFVGREHR